MNTTHRGVSQKVTQLSKEILWNFEKITSTYGVQNMWHNPSNMMGLKQISLKKQNMMKYQKYLIEDLKVKLKRVNLIDLNWTYAT